RAAELIEIDAQTGQANLSDQLAAFELIVEVGESCTIEERACTFVDASGVRVGTGVLDCHMSGGAFHAVGHATDANGVQIVTCPSN
ncbi:MAG: hypothetical protein KC925_03130, partial [Candidatus Doudnabacteria bacterium]|nr:hypothetical protein [Candidatus Doudnabacteria bacterium]